MSSGVDRRIVIRRAAVLAIAALVAVLLSTVAPVAVGPASVLGVSTALLLSRGFAVLAVVVSIAGYGIAQSAMAIAERTGLSETVVGGILTAITTASPELVTSIAAVRTGALTLAVGGIIGGNTFDVLFLAGENPDDVRARVIATLEFYGINPKSCRLHFIAGTFSIRADMERLQEEAAKLPNLILTVVDTFAAYFDGEDENSNAQALDFARVVRAITALPSKPAVVMPAHPVKNATRKDLTPKGGSSLLNEVDGNLTLWNNDGLISLHWQGKHRGPDFDPLKLELEGYTSDSLKDRKGRHIPTILAKPVLEMRATQIARDSISLEDRLLLNISDDTALTKRQRAEALGISPTRCQRMIDKLREQKLIKKFRAKYELTKDGERAVQEIISGQEQPPEADE